MSGIDFLPLSSTTPTVSMGGKVSFEIVNNSAETVTLQWQDYNGNLVSYGPLLPGQTRMQDSAAGHVWELTSSDNNVGFKFVTNAPGEIVIGSNNQPSFIDLSEKIIQTSNGLWSTYMGYGVIDVAKSLGVAHTTDLPMNGQTNYAALDAIDAPSAWAAGYTGKGVKVAIIDGGIASNPEIAGKIVGGYDFQDKDTDPSPDNGAYRDHALGVASIIAGSHAAQTGPDTMGVAPDAQLLNVRVGSSQGSSSVNMALGIHWAVDNGAKVICMPLESPGTQIDQVVADALHYAYQHNVVCVVIGGNYSSFTPTGPALIAAQLKGEVVDVGNYDLAAGTPFASSNLPGNTPFPWVMASSTGWVPNGHGGYNYWGDGGTSFAGPYVAGLAALLWQQNPNASASEIINKITAGATLGNSQAMAAFTTVQTGVMGSASADVFAANPSTSYDGGAGVDVVKYAGVSSNYLVQFNNDSSVDVTNTLDHTSNHLLNIERLQFTDTSVALDVAAGQLSGEAYRLYQAAFNRTPDAAGLSYWLNVLDHGTALDAVAQQFTQSAEFKSLYGAAPSNTDFLNAVYHNVLQRPADSAGLNYWLDAMSKGMSEASVLSSFSESAENIAQVAKLIGQGFHYSPYA